MSDKINLELTEEELNLICVSLLTRCTEARGKQINLPNSRGYWEAEEKHASELYYKLLPLTLKEMANV